MFYLTVKKKRNLLKSSNVDGRRISADNYCVDDVDFLTHNELREKYELVKFIFVYESLFD
jgi:hypothetical protein